MFYWYYKIQNIFHQYFRFMNKIKSDNKALTLITKITEYISNIKYDNINVKLN